LKETEKLRRLDMAVVYWSARNVNGMFTSLGNHHFVLIIVPSGTIPGGIPPQKHKGVNFMTLGAFNVNGSLTVVRNYPDDTRSVRERIDNPGRFHLEPNMDFQGHRVRPPNGCDFAFATDLVDLSLKYEWNSIKFPIPYDNSDWNCAAWVNTLFKVSGVPESERLKAGEFWGVDWGEEELIPEGMFL
jgi:hypothetical protein